MRKHSSFSLEWQMKRKVLLISTSRSSLDVYSSADRQQQGFIFLPLWMTDPGTLPGYFTYTQIQHLHKWVIKWVIKWVCQASRSGDAEVIQRAGECEPMHEKKKQRSVVLDKNVTSSEEEEQPLWFEKGGPCAPLSVRSEKYDQCEQISSRSLS